MPEFSKTEDGKLKICTTKVVDTFYYLSELRAQLASEQSKLAHVQATIASLEAKIAWGEENGVKEDEKTQINLEE